MSQLLKKSLVTALRPLAFCCNKLNAVRRLWASARLNSALGGHVPASVVVLNTPELHGNRQISLGENLYLYRDLYFETRESGSINIGNAVVTKDIPAGAVAVGIPAKVIKP